jgi:hypothetical protein
MCKVERCAAPRSTSLRGVEIAMSMFVLVTAPLLGCGRVGVQVGAGSDGSGGAVGGQSIGTGGAPGSGGAPGPGGAPAAVAAGTGGRVGGAVGAAGAVGGEGGAGAGSAPALSLQVQACDDMTAALCMRGALCSTDTNATTCQPELELEFGCARADGLDFSVCGADAAAGTCASLYPGGGLTVPATCETAVHAVPLSDSQSACYDLVDRLCERGLQCAGGMVDDAAAIQDCEDSVTTDLASGIPCLLATATGSDYAACLQAISTLPCPANASGQGGQGAGGAAGAGGAGGIGAGGSGTGSGAATGLAAIPACASAITVTP